LFRSGDDLTSSAARQHDGRPAARRKGGAAMTTPAAAPLHDSPWERGATRFWIVLVSALAVLATVASIVAIAIADTGNGNGVSTGGGGGQPAASTASQGPELDLSGDPGASFQARDPRAPATPTGTVHQITLRATEEELEIAPGHRQLMWTFEGQVPGPTLRGKVGDVFEITL